MHPYTLSIALLLFAKVQVQAFVVPKTQTRTASKHGADFPLGSALHLFWFGKDSDSSKDGPSDKQRKGEGLGGVAQVMDSMEGFKKAQQVGILTGNLMQELGGTIVEGNAADGKVRVFYDAQQRPKRVQIDENYISSVDIDELNSQLALAMQDGYKKSRDKMEEKMKDLYGELGLA